MNYLIFIILTLMLSGCRYNEFSFYKNTYNLERSSYQSDISLGKEYSERNAVDFKIQQVQEIRDGKELNYYLLFRSYIGKFDINLTFPIATNEINEISKTLAKIQKDLPNSGNEYKFYKNIVTNGDDFLILDAKLKQGEFKIRFIFSQDLIESEKNEVKALFQDEASAIYYEELAKRIKSRYQYEDIKVLTGLISLFQLN